MSKKKRLELAIVMVQGLADELAVLVRAMAADNKVRGDRDAIEAWTIERCAQIAESFTGGRDIASAIRAEPEPTSPPDRPPLVRNLNGEVHTAIRRGTTHE